MSVPKGQLWTMPRLMEISQTLGGHSRPRGSRQSAIAARALFGEPRNRPQSTQRIDRSPPEGRHGYRVADPRQGS